MSDAVIVAFATLFSVLILIGFVGHRRKTDRDIEERLAAIEQLVGELTGDDLARPVPREVRIEPDRTPRLPGG